ncbi:MAG TPA: lasso peptide biosynthesis B2 protein [Longimicrobiales bacterium]|nr:lasso peptide biosynthesis B2 protein [Longimicrobiales bacterium]
MTFRLPRLRPRAPSVFTSFAMIAATDLALRRLGFARSVAIARRLAGKRAERPEARSLTAAVCNRVALAGVFYPGRARCLEQSLALYVLLRRRGVPAQLRLGVQPYPFNAHAWVELDGVALNETAETLTQFVPMDGFGL